MTGAVELAGANLAMTGYTKPAAAGAVTAADTVNAAVGKLEKGLEGKQAAGNYVVSNGAMTAGTKTKITYDGKGLVTGGGDATAADVKMTGYVKATAEADITGADTVLEALGKVERKTDGKVSGNAAITAGTGTRITFDAKGLVTKGENAAGTDIKVGSYAKGTGAVTAADTVSEAIGKVEAKADAKARITVAAAEPAGAATGDFWYQTV